ncbi:MAG: PAS domain S-box protein [Phycisphaeraceae bacterium]
MANTQSPGRPGRLVAPLRILSQAAGAAVVTLGGLVLAGWHFEVPWLVTLLPGGSDVTPNTAVGFVLTGAAVLLLGAAQPGAGRHWMARAAAGAAALLGGLTFVQYVFDWQLGVDQLLFDDHEALYPGRMAPNSALCLLLFGLALLLLDVSRRFAQSLALLASLLVMLATLGYLYDVEALYGLGSFRTMSLGAALTFILLAIGIFLARLDRGWTAILASNTQGGFLARRLLPVALVVPAFTGWMRLIGQERGFYNFEEGVALFAAAIIVLLTFIAWGAAGAVHRLDVIRERVHAEMAVEHAVIRRLTTTRSFREAAPKVMKIICEHLDAEVGMLWLPDDRDGTLRSAGHHECGLPGRGQSFAEVSRTMTFQRGEGLPGQVWANCQPVWTDNLEDGTGLPRSAMAKAAGLRGGVGFPILVGETCFGVMEFFTSRRLEPGESMQHILAEIGYEFGRHIQQRLAERAVRRSEARHRAILQSALDSIITMDDRGRIVEFNPAAERTFGYSAQDAIGRPLTEMIIPERLREAHEKGLARFLSDGETAILGHRIEMPAMRADGSEFPAELTITATRLSDGSPFFTGYLRDITQRVEAERTLAESEDYFRSAFENAAVGLAHLAVDGRWLRVNQRFGEILGYERDELLATRFQDVVHPEEASSCQETIERLQRHNGDVPPVERRCLRKDGQVVWCSVTMSLLRHRHGKGPRCIIVAFQDVTARRLAERQLERLNDTLEQQVAERTAVAEQRAGQLRKLARQLTRAEEQERRRLAQMLHDHLQQLLVAAKFRLPMIADQPPGHRETAAIVQEVDSLLDESVEASRSLARELSPPILHEAGLAAALHWLAGQMREKHGLMVHVHADESLEVTAGEFRSVMFQATRELLFNVVKHAGSDEARVTLNATGDGRVRLVVEDDGAGFEVQADEADDPDRAGSFGLASIRERMDLLGGSFSLESVPGDGTRVALLAPLDGAAETDVAQPAPAQLPPMPGPCAVDAPTSSEEADVAAHGEAGPIRVLLADDHTLVREMLVALLRKERDMDVVGEAADGQEAVALAGRLKPDVVVMDITMPEMDGIEATRRITAVQPGVCVIGLSMHEADTMAEKMREAGAACYLPKDGPARLLMEGIRACRPASSAPAPVPTSLPTSQ